MNATLTLVTGGTGLVGNNVVRLLLQRGDAVRVLARRPHDLRELAGLDVDVVTGDVCDAESVSRAAAGATHVVHCAGYVQLGRTRLDLHRAINVEGTRNVARAARDVGARMVHVSSCDALGAVPDGEPADEDTPVDLSVGGAVQAPYVVTKREAEGVVLDLVAEGLAATIVNPGFMLGPWDWKPSSGRMLLAVASGRGYFAPHGNFSVCDVRDVAAGILAALDREPSGRRYVLAGATYTYLDAWRLFAEVTGASRPLGRAYPWLAGIAGWTGDVVARVTGREPDVNSGAVALAKVPKCYSSARAERELGYRMRPTRLSVEDAWAWFREYGYVKKGLGASGPSTNN